MRIFPPGPVAVVGAAVGGAVGYDSADAGCGAGGGVLELGLAHYLAFGDLRKIQRTRASICYSRASSMVSLQDLESLPFLATLDAGLTVATLGLEDVAHSKRILPRLSSGLIFHFQSDNLIKSRLGHNCILFVVAFVSGEYVLDFLVAIDSQGLLILILIRKL